MNTRTGYAWKLLHQNRDINFLFWGQLFSFTGTMMTGVGLHYHIWQTTHSTVWVGFLDAIQLIAIIPTGLWGGVLADRMNRRHILICSEGMLVCLCLLLAFGSALDKLSMQNIFMLNGLMFFTAGFHRPALTSLQQQLVTDASDLMDLGILNTFSFSFGVIVGPALAGVLIVSFDVTAAYWADVLTFIVSLAALWFVANPLAPTHENHSATPWEDLQNGLRFAYQNKILWGSYFVDFAAMVLAMPNVFFPNLAESWQATTSLGLLYAAMALGAAFTSLCLAPWCHHITAYGKGEVVAAALWGLAIACVGMSHSIYGAMCFLMLAGMCDAASGIFRSTLWNTIIPRHLRGRLAGIEFLSYTSGPKMGSLLGGVVATFMGVPMWIMCGGLMCSMVVASTAWLFPMLWRYDAPVTATSWDPNT